MYNIAMEQSIRDAIEDYYKLKNIYETKNKQDKKKLLHQKKGKLNKKQSLATFQPVCVVCGNVGGTLFKQEKTKLIALCNANPPCKLDIEIDRGEYEKITDLYKIVYDNYQESRKDIIKTKLDMLFGFITEEKASVMFDDIKKDYDESVEELKVFDDIFSNIFQGKRNIKDIDEIKKNILIIKKKITESTDLYKEEGGTPSIVSDIVSLYTNELFPEYKKLRSELYKNSEIEIDENDNYKLIQQPYLNNEIEYELESPVVIKYSK